MEEETFDLKHVWQLQKLGILKDTMQADLSKSLTYLEAVCCNEEKELEME